MEGTPQVQGGTSRGRGSGKRRVLKVLLWLVAILIVVMGVTGYFAYRAAGTAPQWYVEPDPAASSQPAREGESRLVEVQTWAGARYAWEYARGSGRRPLVREPESRRTIRVVEAEINAMLQKWFVIYGEEKVGGRRVKEMVRNPMVHITADQITLAASLPDLGGRMVSADFRPEVLADGQLNLQFLGVRSGTLPLPEFAWATLRDRLTQELTKQLPRFASAAAMDRGGGANEAFVAAVSIPQGIATLEHRPTLNAMFLPVVAEGTALPMRVESVDLKDGELTLTVEAMTPEARKELLGRVRKTTDGR